MGRTVHKLLSYRDLTMCENCETEELFVREKKQETHRLVKGICKCTCQVTQEKKVDIIFLGMFLRAFHKAHKF